MDENEFVKVPLWFFNFLACPINQLAGVESKQLEEELEKKVYENCNEKCDLKCWKETCEIISKYKKEIIYKKEVVLKCQ